jgi:hypothetical protein
MKFSFSPIAFLRWLANYGLSLSAADYVLPEECESNCPFARLLQSPQKPV